MRQLLYVSSARRGFDPAQLEIILSTARTNNAKHDITGMLLYLNGAFMQVLEGPADAVGRVYAAIATDDRHWGTSILLDRESERAFSGWSMGLEVLADQEGDPATFRLDTVNVEGRLKVLGRLDLATMVSTFYKINKSRTQSDLKTG